MNDESKSVKLYQFAKVNNQISFFLGFFSLGRRNETNYSTPVSEVVVLFPQFVKLTGIALLDTISLVSNRSHREHLL